MDNYIQPGNTVTFTNGTSADLASGEAFLLGTHLLGVATTAVADGDEGEACIEGVFDLPKKTTDTPAAFDPAYWDDTAKEFTTTQAGNILAGVWMAAYISGDTTAHVRLIPQSIALSYDGHTHA